MVLANTEELHEKIDRLCSRVRELEDGLRTLQSTVSDQTHPLLREDLLNIKAPTATLSTTGRNESPPQATSSNITLAPRLERIADEDSLIDAFGIVCLRYS